MGWYMVTAPGKPNGPCARKECGHLDCNSTRAMMELRCPICNKPLAYESRVYFTKDDQGRGRAQHAVCVEREADRATPTKRIRCACGRWLELDDPMTNTCACGADYNGSGQRLAPREQWGEETGETAADILGPRGQSDFD